MNPRSTPPGGRNSNLNPFPSRCSGNVTKGIQMAIVAASEGLITAASIVNWLMDYDASNAV